MGTFIFKMLITCCFILMQETFSLLHRSDQLFDDKVDLEQPESDFSVDLDFDE